MKKWIIGIVAVVVLGGAGYAYSSGMLGTAGQAAKTPTPVPAVKASDKVVSDGKVVPARYAALSLPVGGTVTKINVAEGDQVQAGQVLVSLDNSLQAAAVAQAEAGVKRAQAQLELVKVGPRPQDIDAAKAAVDVAQAALVRTRQGASAADIDAAKAGVVMAQAKLDQAVKGLTPEQLEVWDRQLKLAKNQEYLTQQNVQEMSYRTDYGTSHSNQTPFFSKDIGGAQVGVAYESTKLVEAQIAAAKAPPTPEQLAQLQSAVDQAAAQVAKLETGPTAAEVGVAEAQVRQAQAQLAVVQAGPRPEAVAAAQADVITAQAALDQAKAALAQTELKAPFAGAIASLDVRQGEQVLPGVAIGQLADLSAWQIETTDLTELMVGNVKVGNKATVTFDALAGVELPGQVTKVKSLGLTKQGDIIYTVTVKPDKVEPALRWNMTSSVSIATQK